MATDFFERQSTARRNTWWLVVMFLLSVVAIVGTTFVAATVAVNASDSYVPRTHDSFDQQRESGWEVPIAAAGGALAVIVLGSLFKIVELSGGGSGVAERMGGRRIYPNTTDFVEQRLLNVVEEMALASGVPVPPVYLLKEEQGINAFAAGFSPSDAVIGVTRGCAEQLSRDQLQGVIAHEFSHILNGDMRLNIRLIGILFGILLLGLIGRMLVRVAAHGGGRRSKKDGTLYLLLIGAGLVVLGFVGSLCGNLIKAAVSRQREYLADASAVQFTRNPPGLAGALKRIGAAVFGSRLKHPNAAELSHMYFSQGVWEGLSGLMATHPPLEKRILALEPSWDGKFPAVTQADRVAELAAAATGLVGEEAAVAAGAVPATEVQNAADQIGNPTEAHRQYVRQLVAALPPAVVEAAHDPYGARAVIYAGLLDRDPQVRAVQLRALENQADPGVLKLTRELIPAVEQVDVRAWLPLVDMTMPALRALTVTQYRTFCQCFQALVKADQRIGLFEWTLHQILLRHLRPQFEPMRPPRIMYYGLQRLGQPCSVLLSTLARASQGSDQEAFDSGAQRLSDVPLQLLPPNQCTLSELQRSLQELSQVAPKHRQRLIEACAACICADGKVNVQEAELLRAVCDMLECPLPPFLAGQPVSPGRPAKVQA